jgi:hypothetical protein
MEPISSKPKKKISANGVYLMTGTPTRTPARMEALKRAHEKNRLQPPVRKPKKQKPIPPVQPLPLTDGERRPYKVEYFN